MNKYYMTKTYLNCISQIILLNRIMQSCRQFDFSDTDIPSEERKASVAVVNLTGDTGRQIFLSNTLSFISLYAVAAAFL